MTLKKSHKAIAFVVGGAAAVSIVALVALAPAFFTQGAGQVAPPLGKDSVNSDASGSSNDNGSVSTNPVGKTTSAAATILKCHDDTVEAEKVVVVSATLADRSSGEGIPGKQVIFTILPGNPVAVLPTDGSGKVSMSLNATEFSNKEPAVFVFFDGDKEYEFSSCRIDIATPPQASTIGEPGSAKG